MRKKAREWREEKEKRRGSTGGVGEGKWDYAYGFFGVDGGRLDGDEEAKGREERMDWWLLF